MRHRLTRRDFLRITGATAVAGLVPPGVLAAAEKAHGAAHYSELWGTHGELWDPPGRLPDFSYAGYHMGEKSIPDVPERANVRQFGAKGDGQTDDTQAFKDAIAGTENGAIYVPPGRYPLTDYVIIDKPNLVLRGAGRDRTTLVFPETIGQITDKEVPYSDGLLKIEANSRAERSAQLTTVLGPAKRGDRTLTVASTAGISPGQWIRLYVYNPISGEAPEFIDRAAFPIRNKVPQSDPTYNSFGKYIYGNGRLAMNDERRGWFAGLDVLWLAKVESVGRNTLTLARPLRIDVRTEWKPEVWSCPPVLQEAGLEDFAMEFPDIQYPGHWKEPGSMAVSISGVDCWARRLRIVDADICVVMNGAHCTASDIIMEARLRTGEPTENTENGETGHFAVVTAGPGTQDNLVANCELRTLYVHNLSCGGLANGNVYSAIRTLYPRFDHHGCAPYENLYTEILCMKGGEGFSMSGGWRGDEPQSGIRDTYWNIRTLGTPLSGIHGPDMWPMMNIIGVDGLTTARPAGDSLETWIESWPGEQTRPSNLYLAQLARRLGRSVG